MNLKRFSLARSIPAVGWVTIAGEAGRVTEIRISRRAQHGKLATNDIPPLARSVLREVERYFAGRSRTFDFSPELSRLGRFTARVLRETVGIPYGETISYGELARRIGSPRSARAVGQALGRNPFPVIVPCHRVIARGGELGGFSAGRGLKRRLLAHERRNRKHGHR